MVPMSVRSSIIRRMLLPPSGVPAFKQIICFSDARTLSASNMSSASEEVYFDAMEAEVKIDRQSGEARAHGATKQVQKRQRQRQQQQEQQQQQQEQPPPPPPPQQQQQQQQHTATRHRHWNAAECSSAIPTVPKIPAQYLAAGLRVQEVGAGSPGAKPSTHSTSSKIITTPWSSSETTCRPTNYPVMEKAQSSSQPQQQHNHQHQQQQQQRRARRSNDESLEDDCSPDHPRDLPAAAALSRSMSRASFSSSKRRSLPADVITRPSTSGNIHARPQSRLDGLRATAGLFFQQQQHPPFHPHHRDETTSRRSSVTRASYYVDASPLSPRQRALSPHTRSRRGSSFGTALSEPRQSFDTAYSEHRHHDEHVTLAAALEEPQESPTESSDPQGPDSSVDSQAADTVWDELDELKSRIRKLESSDKKPSTSSAAASGSSDRPRTATTAPTTINSSPKQSRKPDPADAPMDTPAPPAIEQHNEVGSAWSHIHPLLHDALARSRDSLSSNVFHNLEAVVADALQLAALTGSAASSTAIGVANERQVRRRVDNLCRNMTDLCISLRDSKPETSPIVSSPATLPIEHPPADLPLRRFSRTSSLAVTASGAGRSLSRLEQRKASLLGPHTLGESPAASPRSPLPELSASDAESTPTHSNKLQPPRRLSAVPSRTTRSRVESKREGARGEDDRIDRPQSRAWTEYSSSLRATSRIPSQDRTNQDRSPGAPRRTSTSLRESLAARRKYETPPVLEEDGPLPKTRGFLSEPHCNKIPSRTSSIVRTRHLIE